MSEREKIKNTTAWPLYPRLPVKKRREAGVPFTGFIMADEVEADGPINLYKEGSTDWQKFKSLDALLEAGWVGD